MKLTLVCVLAAAAASIASARALVVSPSAAPSAIAWSDGDQQPLSNVLEAPEPGTEGIGGGTDLCEPGTNGVMACPCNNPPSGLGRGCNNNFSTGGARLVDSGNASLSADTLVLTATGMNGETLCAVLQGGSTVPFGYTSGQGVLCLTDMVKRLYIKTAQFGSITAPQAGDQAIHVRAEQMGVGMLPGWTKYYQVAYRGGAIGSCPATPQFQMNATQARRITWGP